MKAARKGRGRGGEDGEPPFSPSPEWVQAFTRQWSEALSKDAHRYAWKQSRKVALLRDVDLAYVVDMVQDIVGDTLLGVIKWDPDRVSLKKHVLDAIKSRTRHDYVRANKFPLLRLDSFSSEAEATVAAETGYQSRISDVTRAALAALRDLATGDRDVNLLLDAYDQLVTKRFDVMKITGLTAKRYDAARNRMERLTEELPARLRDAARRGATT